MEMMDQLQAGQTGNVVSLAVYRHRRGFDLPLPVTRPVQPPAGEMVFFITGGRFEVMVNGVEGIVAAGQFLRVPAQATHALRDIGELPGTFVQHRFCGAPPAQFLNEIALALPLYTLRFPPAGSAAYRRLKAIAR